MRPVGQAATQFAKVTEVSTAIGKEARPKEPRDLRKERSLYVKVQAVQKAVRERFQQCGESASDCKNKVLSRNSLVVPQPVKTFRKNEMQTIGESPREIL